MAPLTFAIWALWTIVLSSFQIKVWIESRHAIVCADRRAVFFTADGADPLSYHLFDDGRLAVIDSGARFPFSLRSARGGVPQANTLRFVDRSSGRKLSSLTATIDGRWSMIGRAFAWSDELFVWTYSERRDPANGNPVRSYRRFLTDGKAENQIAGDAAFEPRAVDVRHQRIASLEERQRILGAQPKEDELPPQIVRIESFAGPAPGIVATFPVRRALRFFFDGGALLVLRWEGDTVPPYWQYRYRIFLDRHDLSDYATTWTVELTPQPTEQGRGSLGPDLVITPAQSSGRLVLRYLDNIPELVMRELEVDVTSGELVESSVLPTRVRWKASASSEDAELVWRRHGTRNCLYEGSR